MKARKSASAISVISPSFSHPRAQKIADKFTAQNITDVKVLWEPGSEFKNLLADAEFNLVASRSAQAAVIKAIKAGKANVDLSTPTTPGDGSDGGGSNPSGGTPAGGNTEQSGGTSQGTDSNPSGDNKGDAGQDGSGEDNEL